MEIYLASSWRNPYINIMRDTLRLRGFNVYDFRENEAFNWGDIQEKWKEWSPDEYIHFLNHDLAKSGFDRDYKTLLGCDVLVLVNPCGSSAHLELGVAHGLGKPCYAWCPEIREPELMLKIADYISTNIHSIIAEIERLI